MNVCRLRCIDAERHLESGHCFRFASLAVRSCGKLTLMAEELCRAVLCRSIPPSLRQIMKSEAACQKINWLQGDKDDPSSTLHCITAITGCMRVCVFMCVFVCAVQAGGVAQGLTFNLNAHKSCHEHHLHCEAFYWPLTPFSLCCSRSITQNSDTLKMNQLLLFRSYLLFLVLISIFSGSEGSCLWFVLASKCRDGFIKLSTSVVHIKDILPSKCVFLVYIQRMKVCY